MSKPSMKDKAKKFITTYKEEIIVAAVTVAAIGVFIAKVDEAKKKPAELARKHNEWAAVENEWLDDVNNEGKVVYLLHDYTYLLVPEDTKTEWIQDRPKHP